MKPATVIETVLGLQTETLREQCRELGEILGVDVPVPEPVLLAALNDETYANNLLACRREPTLLSFLLDHPPSTERPSALALAERASQSLLRWARVAFTVVDDETYRHRLAACSACPYLMEPDEHRVLYRAVAGSSKPKVCGRCGCVVENKARRTSEHCPAQDPDDPGSTRWGEPRIVSTNQAGE